MNSPNAAGDRPWIKTPPVAVAPPEAPRRRGFRLLRRSDRLLVERLVQRCIPPGLHGDSEVYRRARLITGFGILGSIFGGCFAVFYLAIGHLWGAAIVCICSLGVAGMPALLRHTGSTRLCGNLLTLILVLGFGGLCSIEGGVQGHAIAWLAAIPLCALLLVDGRTSLFWCLVCTALTATFIALEWHGVNMPVLYPMKWNRLVSAAGYLSLTVFMCVLGLIFEKARRRAFGKMRRALGSLSVANDRLRQADQEKNNFLGIAAHDLKNPLNVVIGFADLIATYEGPDYAERSRQDAGAIIEASNRMVALVTQLLDVNTIEEGRFPIELEPCDLGALSHDVIGAYASAAAKKGVTIHATESPMPARVMADAKAIFQILDNLFSNALKYSPRGGEVFVRIRHAPGSSVWEVQDQGAGLSEEEQGMLFQKFTKLSTRPTAGETSTGLGLSIVKMLSEAMGGAVECRSRKGEGCTFSLRLPEA